MDIVIGMLLSFLLGAYVRKPFLLFTRKEVQPNHSSEPDAELEQFLKEEAENERKRQIQMFKALNWNGGKDKLDEI